MILQLVRPEQIRSYWPTIKKGVDKLVTKSITGWIPEDLYCDVHEGRTQLYLLIDNKYYVGFVAVQIFNQNMHIWTAYCEKPDQLEVGLNLLKDLATQDNIQTITFSSDRKAWQKVASKLGFRPNTYLLSL